MHLWYGSAWGIGAGIQGEQAIKRWAVGLAVAVVLVVLSGAAPIQGAILYSVTDLGDLRGGEDVSHAMAVNNLGALTMRARWSEYPIIVMARFCTLVVP